MQQTVAMVVTRRSGGSSAAQRTPAIDEGSGSHAVPPASIASSDDALEAELEQQLAGLKRALAQMGEHLDEALGDSGKGKQVARRAPSPEPELAPGDDGSQALANLKASLDRMRQTLGLPEEEAEPESPVEQEHAVVHGAPPAPEDPLAQGTAPAVGTDQTPPNRPPVPTRRPPAVPNRPPVPTRRPPPVPNQQHDAQHAPADDATQPTNRPPATDPPADTALATANPPARSHDLDKRVWKAASYGYAALGTGMSFVGWVASYWVGPKIQQTSQTAGGLAKNVAGSAGDYFDMKEKARKADNDATTNGLAPDARAAAVNTATKGMYYKIGGQLVSAIGQATTIAGLFAPGAGVTRPLGATANGLGMLLVAYGELGQGNRFKAAANFAGAVCNFIGAAGYGLSPKAQATVAKDIAEALIDVGADSNAWTPLGGAVDDSTKSKAPGDTRWQKMQGDPKPRGQAINGAGAWLNFVASVLSRRSESRLAEGDAEVAGALKIASIGIGGCAGLVSTWGNLRTAEGEGFPVDPSRQRGSDVERDAGTNGGGSDQAGTQAGIELDRLPPANA